MPDETPAVSDADAPEPADAPAEADAPPEAEPEPEPDPAHVELLARLDAALGEAVIEHADNLGNLVVRVRTDAWGQFANVARAELECDYLSFVSGIDWAPVPKDDDEEATGDTSAPVQPSEMTFGAAGSAGRFQVFGHVQSTAKRWGLTVKADVDEADPVVESWVPVYAGADWHEREAWEMYGFRFEGHPALRHLYLPAEFEGHPLRKDFPLLARTVKPWPGLVDVEAMPEEPSASEATSEGEPSASEATSGGEPSASEATSGGDGGGEG